MIKPSEYANLADDSASLLKRVQNFCISEGIAESTFGRLAVNDGKLVNRIGRGSRLEVDTVRRIANFMDDIKDGKRRVVGRPKRQRSSANEQRMAELVDTETSIRTSGSFAFHEQRQRFHVFANTTNESWMLAERIARDLDQLKVQPPGIRILYAPMDNGIALTRSLRAIHARHPNVPVQVVLKGRGLEDLRNTMGRLVDRLVEHPMSVFVLTNLYLREAVNLTKTSTDNPEPVHWHEANLKGVNSYDYQQQLASVYAKMGQHWRVAPGEIGQPVYACPSVITVFRDDHRFQLEQLIPTEANTDTLEYDYAVLNHPYLHTHTMTFRTDFVLKPVIERLALNGHLLVVQAHGNDPAHELVQKVWPDQVLHRVSRYDIIKAARQTLQDAVGRYSFSGLTDTASLFRFDMHTLPVIEGERVGALSLASAWNNALYFVQVKESMAQAAYQDETAVLNTTESVLRKHGGLWFLNESFSVTRTD